MRIPTLRTVDVPRWALLILVFFVGRAGRSEETTPPEALPAGSSLAGLEVFPGQIELTARFAYRQLLVTAVLDGGERVDATRLARIEGGGDGAVVAVSPTGLVTPCRDGVGELRIEVGGKTSVLPVRVTGQTTRLSVDYVRDVQPVLSRLGCNAGTCHGSLNGKNGFKLSLRGNDYEFDHLALTDDLAGRRFNRADPARSLFLLKISGAVPHEGGVLTRPGEPYYEILKAWVTDGVGFDPSSPRVDRLEIRPRDRVLPLPGMKQQMAVLAHYQDGMVRDVTREAFIETNNTEVTGIDRTGLVTATRRGEAAILARYEGRYQATRFFVMGDRSDFVWKDVPEYNRIDSLVYQKLRKVKTAPSGVCTDAEFLRRVYLDLVGLPPTARDVRTFLQDRRDARLKREELVDRLIGSAEFVDYWTNKWADLLQVNRKYLDLRGVEALRGWIRQAVASNMPYNRFARELLTASGSTLEHPPAAYFRPNREPDLAMENTTQLFLGVRFNCNKCHDHPFERWTQKNHWELAAFFARVGRKPGEAGKAEEIIFDKEEGEVEAPYDGLIVAPAFPYQHEGEIPEDATRREKLAFWLTSPENPYFAKSYVNRIWSYFLGVGIIDPVDDIRASNPPTNPELLDYLTREFIGAGFDVRHIMRLICTSRVYQHSILTTRWNEDDEINFSHALARRLPAETLFDAVHRATGSVPSLPGVRIGTRAVELPDSGVKVPDGFLDLFGRPPRESVCECERASGMSLGQALNLVNGPTVAEAIRDPRNAISSLVAVEKDPGAIVDELFLSILSRPPTSDERTSMVRALDAGNRETAESLGPDDARLLAERYEAWETRHRAPLWVPVETGLARASGGATLSVLEDGTILASGDNPETSTYTVVAWTDLTDITGVRLEVLPDDTLPEKGPGRAENGNFVLSELRLAAAPAMDPAKAVSVELRNASQTHAQKDFPAARALDGKPETGWAIANRFGTRHRAVFEVGENVGGAGGTILTFTLQQQHGSKHTIGKFRLEVTRSARPVRVSALPEEIAAILALPDGERTPEQEAELFRHFVSGDTEIADKIRLSAAQDIAWALINSPAFLFNR